MVMDGPIPGQSLTREPRNAAYERPPEITDPNDAILWHLSKLSDPEKLDNLLFTLEYGLPVKHATQAALTLAVAKGVHNIDVSLIIAPVIHKFITKTAEQAGIDFMEDFDNSDREAEDEKNKVKMLIDKAMAETPQEERDTGYQMLGEMAEATPEIDVEQETQGEVEPEVQELAAEVDKPTAQRGLMARG